MKKLFQIVAATMLISVSALSLAACGSDKVDSNSGNGGKIIEIGIVQIVEHPSLNSIREAFVARLAEKGYEEGKNIHID